MVKEVVFGGGKVGMDVVGICVWYGDCVQVVLYKYVVGVQYLCVVVFDGKSVLVFEIDVVGKVMCWCVGVLL